MPKPILVAITGASGAIYGVEALRLLRELGRPGHLILSQAGARTLSLETGLDRERATALAEKAYDPEDVGAAPASGSFATAGMLVAPCTIKTLSAITNSYASGLIARAADVHLKERRPLVLMVRETPLHKGHLELMARAADLGAFIMPPVPALYHRPASIEEMARHTAARALALLGVEHGFYQPWSGAPLDEE
ncbi:3-octaprenyl-4-hydroxybenzoate carboxy-lyase [Desulfocarbo indianensis]|nr:3-octaprenyl-4-hydroxybenzoate carboxy-lyase [Desulfocarbo indianensis]